MRTVGAAAAVLTLVLSAARLARPNLAAGTAYVLVGLSAAAMIALLVAALTGDRQGSLLGSTHRLPTGTPLWTGRDLRYGPYPIDQEIEVKLGWWNRQSVRGHGHMLVWMDGPTTYATPETSVPQQKRVPNRERRPEHGQPHFRLRGG